MVEKIDVWIIFMNLPFTDLNIKELKNVATSFSFQEPVKSKSTILLFTFYILGRLFIVYIKDFDFLRFR